jgi:hypothetical protein
MKSVKSAHSCIIKISRTIPGQLYSPKKLKACHSHTLSPGNYCVPLAWAIANGWWALTDRMLTRKKNDSDYFKARVLTGNPGARTYSSLRCLFFLRHRVLQQQSLVCWLRRHTPHILSYRLHHYGRGKRPLDVRSIARTSLPISLIAAHNGCLCDCHLASLHLVAVHGVEEGPCPPLVPFERLLLTLVFRLPTMLLFQPLGLDLIFPNRILAARPVEVDLIALA